MYSRLIRDLRESYDKQPAAKVDSDRETESSAATAAPELPVPEAMSATEPAPAAVVESQPADKDKDVASKELHEKYARLEKSYFDFKNTLDEDDLKLANEIESKLKLINESKFDLFKLKSQEDMALQVSSIKLVMERVNMATSKWLNEEFEKKILKAASQKDPISADLIENYKNEIGILNVQIKEMKSSIESEKSSFRSDLDISLRAIENDYQSRNDQLSAEIESLKSLNASYLSEIGNLKQSLGDYDSEIESLRKSESVYREQIRALQAKLKNDMACVAESEAETAATELIDFGDLDESKKIVVKNQQDEMLIECLDGDSGQHESKVEARVEAEFRPKEPTDAAEASHVVNQVASFSSFTYSYDGNKSEINEQDMTADDLEMAEQHKRILAAMSGEIDTSINLDEAGEHELDEVASNVDDKRLIQVDITYNASGLREADDAGSVLQAEQERQELIRKHEELVKELYRQIEEQREEIIQLKLGAKEHAESEELVKQLYKQIEDQREELIRMKLHQSVDGESDANNHAIEELEARLNEISDYKAKYLELKEALESMSHPAFDDLRNELQRSFYAEYDELKCQSEQRLQSEIVSNQKSLDKLEQTHRTEIDALKKDFEQTLNASLLDLKKELEKAKPENESLDFSIKGPANTTVDKNISITSSLPNTTLDANEADELISAHRLDQTPPHIHVGGGGDDEEEKQRQRRDQKALESDSGFVLDQQTTSNQSPSSVSRDQQNSSVGGSGIHLEVPDSHVQSQTHSPGSLSDLELLIPAANAKMSAAPSNDMSRTATSECLAGLESDSSSFTKTKMTQLELSESTNSASSSAPSAQSSPAYAKEARDGNGGGVGGPSESLLIKQTSSGTDETQGRFHSEYIAELELKINQLDEQNKMLQATLKNVYEKDGYAAPSRPQHQAAEEDEDKDKLIQSLQDAIQQITNDRDLCQINNQGLASVLSKALLINASIDDHINRRLNRILKSQHTFAASSTNALINPATQGSSIYLTVGGHGAESSQSPRGLSDGESNEDLSDEGLDISQRICDSLASGGIANAGSNDFSSDENLLEASVRLQSSIDRIMTLLEEKSKQVAEAQSLQIQLAFKLEETQSSLEQIKTKHQNVELDYSERIEELQKKLVNFEGLADAYEHDIKSKKQSIVELERSLQSTMNMLQEARTDLESQRYENSNLEIARKDLVAQQSYLTNHLQDSQIKELVQNNSYLLEEKHELEYKLNRTAETTAQQIRDLEETIEKLNEEIKSIKDKHAVQVNELTRQIESMDAQLKSNKEFIQNQLSEREQEREEYEAKISEMNTYLSRRATQLDENHDSLQQRCRDMECVIEEKTDRLNKLSLSVEELERRLDEKERENDKLETNLGGLREEIDELLKKNKSQSETIDELREKLQEAQELYRSNEKRFQDWIVEKEDLVELKEHLQKELNNYMSFNSDLKIHKENMEHEFNERLKRNEELLLSNTLQIQEKENQINDLKAQINELNENLQSRVDAELNHLNLLTPAESSELAALRQELEACKRDNEHWKKLADEYSHKLQATANLSTHPFESKKFSDASTSPAENQTATAVTNTSSLTSSSSSSLAELSQKLIENKNEEIDELQSQLSAAQLEIEKGTQRIEQLEKQIEMLRADQSNAAKPSEQSELDELREKLRAASVKLEEREASLNSLELMFKENQEEYESSLEKLRAESERCEEELRQQIAELQSRKPSLAASEQQAGEAADEELRGQLDECQAKIGRLTEQLAEMNEREAETSGIVASQKALLNEMEERLRIMETERDSLNEQIDGLRAEVKSQVDRCASMQAEYEEKLAAAQEASERQAEDLERRSEKATMMDDSMSEASRDHQRETIEAQLSRIRELEAGLYDSNSAADDFKQKVSELELKIYELRQTNEDKDQQIDEYDAKLAAQFEKIEHLERELTSVGEDIKQKDAEIELLNSEIAEMKMNYDQLETNFNQQAGELAKMRELGEQDELLERKTEEIAELGQANAGLKSRLASLEDEKLELIKELNVKRAEMADQSDRLEELKQENQSLYARVDQSQALINEINAQKDAEIDQLRQSLAENSNLDGEENLRVQLKHEYELREKIAELESVHRLEMVKMKEALSGKDSEVSELIEALRQEHQAQLGQLKREHDVQMHELSQRLQEESERKIKEMRERYEKELADGDSSSSQDFSLSSGADLGKKLRDQVKLTKELDSHLITDTRRLASQKQSSSDSGPVEPILVPREIKDILDKLNRDGVALLSLSELLQLKNFIQKTAALQQSLSSSFSSDNDNTSADLSSHNKRLSKKLAKMTLADEKGVLVKEIYELREMITKLTPTAVKGEDSSASLVKAIADILAAQNQGLLAELRSYVVNMSGPVLSNGADLSEKLVHELEAKIEDKIHLNQKLVDYLVSTDRQVLIDERKSLMANINKLHDDLNEVQEAKRQLKQDLTMMEYAKDTEVIKGNDLKQSLNAEKIKYLDAMEKFNLEKKKTNSLQKQLADISEELSHIKQLLDAETLNNQNVCNELEILKRQQQALSSPAPKADQQLRKSYSDLEKRFHEVKNQLFEEQAKNETLASRVEELKARERSFSRQTSTTTLHQAPAGQAGLERLRQSLEYLAVRLKNEFDWTVNSQLGQIRGHLDEIIDELKQTRVSFNGSSGCVQQSSSFETKIIEQNHELIETIKRLNSEKSDLIDALGRLEEEVWQYRNRTKHEMSAMSEHDREKFKKLYYKYLRAESFRKSLVYQKRFLLIMLSGYEETEREILSALKLDSQTVSSVQQQTGRVGSHSSSNGYHSSLLTTANRVQVTSSSSSSSAYVQHHHHHHHHQQQHKSQTVCSSVQHQSAFYSSRFTVHKPKSRFRTGVICVIAISRIKFLVRKHTSMMNRVDSYKSK